MGFDGGSLQAQREEARLSCEQAGATKVSEHSVVEGKKKIREDHLA